MLCSTSGRKRLGTASEDGTVTVDELMVVLVLLRRHAHRQRRLGDAEGRRHRDGTPMRASAARRDPLRRREGARRRISKEVEPPGRGPYGRRARLVFYHGDLRLVLYIRSASVKERGALHGQAGGGSRRDPIGYEVARTEGQGSAVWRDRARLGQRDWA